MIEVQNLSRRYGEFTAVDDVSFSVDEGAIVGILGPNGAGKTTTLRMLTGFLRPTDGQIAIGGVDLRAEPVAAKRQLGYLPENAPLYPEMRVDEYLRFRGNLAGMPRGELRTKIATALERCLLNDVQRQIIGTLSKGYRQRVGLAAAILHQPAVLILDEPTVGLDPKQIIAIRELIRELSQAQTLLLSTHILPEVELLCDRILIFDHGRLVAEGTPESLRRESLGGSVLRLELDSAPPDVVERLESLEGVVRSEPDTAVSGSRRYRVHCADGTDVRGAVFGAAVENGWTLLELSRERASLEEVFVRLTTTDAVVGADPSTHESGIDAVGPRHGDAS